MIYRNTSSYEAPKSQLKKKKNQNKNPSHILKVKSQTLKLIEHFHLLYLFKCGNVFLYPFSPFFCCVAIHVKQGSFSPVKTF